MNNYLKLHFSYFFNKYIVMTIILFTILLDFGVLYNSGIFSGYTTLDLNRIENYEMFYIDSIQLIKIAGIIFSIIISALLSSTGNTNLAKYTVQSKGEKFNFILSRIVVIVFVSTAFYINYFVFYLLVVKLYLPYEIDTEIIGETLRLLLIQAYVYIGITVVLVHIIPSFFIIVVPVISFWIMESNAEYNTIMTNETLKSITTFLPNIVYYEGKFVLLLDFTGHIFSFLLLIFGVIIMFLFKDIN